MPLKGKCDVVVQISHTIYTEVDSYNMRRLQVFKELFIKASSRSILTSQHSSGTHTARSCFVKFSRSCNGEVEDICKVGSSDHSNNIHRHS